MVTFKLLNHEEVQITPKGREIATLSLVKPRLFGYSRSTKQAKKVEGVCREHGISEATFYNWKKKFAGMDASQLKRLREVEEENKRLKRMYVDLSLNHDLLKEVLEKSSEAFSAKARGRLFGRRKRSLCWKGVSCIESKSFDVELHLKKRRQ